MKAKIEKYIGHAEPITATECLEQGGFYEKERNLSAAETLYKEAFERSADKTIKKEAIFSLALLYKDDILNENKALDCFLAAADLGVKGAYHQIGLLFFDGIGVKQDYDKAIYYFEKACKEEDKAALFYLGISNLRAGNEDKAFHYFKQAYESGDEQATFYLRKCYIAGTGVSQDVVQAEKLFREVKDEYHLLKRASQLYLGDIFFYGGDVIKPDISKALHYYLESSTKIAVVKIANCFYAANSVEISSDQYIRLLALVYKLAEEVRDVDAYASIMDCCKTLIDESKNRYSKQKAICISSREAGLFAAVLYAYSALIHGNAEAMCHLGELYNWEFIRDIKVDQELAFELFSDSAKMGNRSAKMMLGDMYLQGRYVQKDAKKAAELYRTAALSVPRAQTRLALLYLKGNGVPQDKTAALELMQSAAAHGQIDAIVALGIWHLRGEMVEQNYEEAVRRFKSGARFKNHIAMMNLANCYYHGYGVEVDYSQATELYKGAFTEYADFIEDWCPPNEFVDDLNQLKFNQKSNDIKNVADDYKDFAERIAYYWRHCEQQRPVDIDLADI